MIPQVYSNTGQTWIRFHPLSDKGMVAVVTGLVCQIRTHGIPVESPMFQYRFRVFFMMLVVCVCLVSTVMTLKGLGRWKMFYLERPSAATTGSRKGDRWKASHSAWYRVKSRWTEWWEGWWEIGRCRDRWVATCLRKCAHEITSLITQKLDNLHSEKHSFLQWQKACTGL